MQEVLDILVNTWKFDLWVFAQWWLYAPLGIPAIAYLTFFFIKWTVLSSPLWIPFYIVASAFQPTSVLNHRKKEEPDRDEEIE